MNDWKVVPRKGPSEDFESYRKITTDALRAVVREKTKVTAIQSASTQRTLSMTDEEIVKYKNRPLPTNEQAQAEAPIQNEFGEWILKSAEETVRRAGLENIQHLEAIRRRSKNTIGPSELSSVSEESKERARQAFTCTPPTPLTEEQKEKLTKMDKIKQLDTMPKAEPEKGFLAWLKKWFPAEEDFPINASMFEKMSKEDQEQWSKTVKEKK